MPFYTDPDPAFHVDKTEENFLKLPFYLAILADPETIIRIRIIRIRIIRTDPDRTKLEKTYVSGKIVRIRENHADLENSYKF